jgi:transposase
MSGLTLLPGPDQIRLNSLSTDGDRVVLVAETRAHGAACPRCGVLSRRVHSHYRRKLADLPWLGLAVEVRLHARRFFCAQPGCPRRIFTERLPGVVAPYGRRTERLTAWVTEVAFALGGAGGARLLHGQGTAICGQTLLRQMRAFPLDEAPSPRVLSIDDFAFRRGRRYGSVLVDLERHRVIDLLPDRSSAAFATWLTEHPAPEVISRDRSGEYALGAREGAPGAVQVADRFHLLKNLGEAVARVLYRHGALVHRVPSPDGTTVSTSLERPDRAASRARTKTTTQQRYAAIQDAAAQGKTNGAIARELGVHRHTVRKYRHLTAAPERRYHRRHRSILAPFEPYLLEQWQQGEHNAMALWRAVRARGYPGAYQNVARFIAALRRQAHNGAPVPPARPGLTPQQAAGLLLVRPERRTSAEQAAVEAVQGLHPEIAAAATLLTRFAGMIRERTGESASGQLAQWMDDAERAGSSELTNFVVKLRQDADAVRAGLTLDYSQGQTEGCITKLKLIKRSMYGRAKFDLLRQRVLYASGR